MRYALIGLLVVFGFAAFGCDQKPGGGKTAPAKVPPLDSAVQPAPVTPPVVPNTIPAQSSTATPNWSIEKPLFDFGMEWKGRRVVHLFDIRNDGAQPLRMSKPKAYCSCSQATAFPEVIEPGKTGQIQFTLDLTNKSGPVNETLEAQTNDPQKPALRVTITGHARNACTMELVEDQGLMDGTTPPEKAAEIAKYPPNFERITTNQNLRRVIRLKNASGLPLKLEMMPIRSAAVYDERGASKVVAPMFDATLAVVQEGEVYDLTIVGKPPFQPGSNVTAIQFTTGIPEFPFFNDIRPTAVCPPRIELTPFKIVFNQQASSRNRAIKIRNNGDTPLKVTSVAVTDPAISVTLLPINPADPTLNEIEVLIPQDPNYLPPTYGEVVRIETTDAERALIDVQILPHMSNPATPRPADKPLQFTPGKMLQ